MSVKGETWWGGGLKKQTRHKEEESNSLFECKFFKRKKKKMKMATDKGFNNSSIEISAFLILLQSSGEEKETWNFSFFLFVETCKTSLLASTDEGEHEPELGVANSEGFCLFLLFQFI